MELQAEIWVDITEQGEVLRQVIKIYQKVQEGLVLKRTHHLELMHGVTYNQNAIDGTGSGGGGAINDNDNSRIFDGGNGGDGIVILRMHSGQYGANYRPSFSGESDIVAFGGYTYVIYRASGSMTI